MSEENNLPTPLTTGVPGADYLPLGSYMDRSYLAYSLSVVLDRAIPDVRDGLKPVHRRILYAMDKLSLNPGSAHKKSARVVGDVIGKYHPHGDQSVYDAMVLMAQPFNLRHPLVDGQGNWGSIDGDSPAAMRYTEARLSNHARLLLEEIDKGTVDFRPNYDGNDEEPTVLPARVPMALLNDQMGIAVGMASDIPAHNLAEVVAAAITLYRNPDATLEELMGHVRGPDFPCGGQIVSSTAELKELYATGRGFVTVRARYEVREDADGWHLVFTQLPPRVSPEEIMLQFEAISNPQPKAKDPKTGRGGAASLTADQRAAKALMLSKVSEINNGAGADTGPVYLEVYPKSSRQKPEELALYLFSVTSLESRVKANMNLINLAGFPAQMSLRDILSDWNAFRFATVTRRCETRLEKVEARLHILQGLLKILLDIDEAIRIIRESENEKAAKDALMLRWELTAPQAEKILDLKLRQLTKLDEVALKAERRGLVGERAELRKVLGERGEMVELIIHELEADAVRFGSPRRTLIEEAAPAVFEEPVVDEPVTIILSKKGWMRSRSGHSLDLSALSFKDGDALHTKIETRTARSLILFDEKGRSYTIGASLVPGGRSEGVPLSSLADLQDKAGFVALFEAKPEQKLLLASTSGYGFITEGGNLLSRNKAGKAVLNCGDTWALEPLLLTRGSESVFAASSSGKFIAFGLDEIGEYPKGKGVKLIGLKPGEKLAALTVFEKTVTLTHRRGKADILLQGEELESYRKKRGGRGKPLPKNALPPAHGVQVTKAEEAVSPGEPEGEGWLFPLQ